MSSNCKSLVDCSALRVRAATGEVLADDGREPLRLSRRERELVAALAVLAQPTCAEGLGRYVVPDASADEARNTVKVYVHRLRRRIGADFIRTDSRGYAFGPAVATDVGAAMVLLQTLKGPHDMPDIAIESILTVAEELMRTPPLWLAEREWYQECARRFRWLSRELLTLSAQTFLNRGHLRDALRAGRALVFNDPCDEEGWDYVIRTQILLGELSAARQSYRHLESALQTDLQVSPSPSLHHLLAAAGAFDDPLDRRRIQNPRSGHLFSNA